MSDGEIIFISLLILIFWLVVGWIIDTYNKRKEEEEAQWEQQQQEEKALKEQRAKEIKEESDKAIILAIKTYVEEIERELDIKIENLQKEIAILKNDLEKFDTLELSHEYYVDNFRAYEIRVNDDRSRNETKTTFKTYGRKR